MLNALENITGTQKGSFEALAFYTAESYQVQSIVGFIVIYRL
jgi:hypothetical protein